MSNGAKIWWMLTLRYKARYFGRGKIVISKKNHRFLKYPWVGLVKMSNFLYCVLPMLKQM